MKSNLAKMTNENFLPPWTRISRSNWGHGACNCRCCLNTEWSSS